MASLLLIMTLKTGRVGKCIMYHLLGIHEGVKTTALLLIYNTSKYFFSHRFNRWLVKQQRNIQDNYFLTMYDIAHK